MNRAARRVSKWSAAIGIAAVGVLILATAFLRKESPTPPLPDLKERVDAPWSPGSGGMVQAPLSRPAGELSANKAGTSFVPPERSDLDPREAAHVFPKERSLQEFRQLTDAVLQGDNRQRALAASRLAESILPDNLVAELIQAFRSTKDAELRAAILTAIQNAKAANVDPLLETSLRSSGEDREASLDVLVQRSLSRQVLSPEFLEAIEALHLQELPAETARSLYRVIAAYAGGGDIRINSWLTSDAVSGKTEQVRILAIQNASPSHPELPALLLGARNSPSLPMQDAVLMKAINVSMLQKDATALSVVTSYLADSATPRQRDLSLDAVQNMAPFVSQWNANADRALDAIHAGMVSYLATNPSVTDAGRGRLVLKQIGR
jgi:hypothetical protein